MRKLLLTLVLLCSVLSFGQSWDAITATNASCLMGACVYQDVDQKDQYAVIQVTGTFTATLQFEVSADKTTFVSVAVSPSSGGGAVTSATAAGTWQVNVAGYRQIRVRASAYTSGTAMVTIRTSQGAYTNSGYPGVTSDGSLGLNVAGNVAIGATALDTRTSFQKPFSGLMSALGAGQSTGLQVISDSTGTDVNGVNTRWPYLLAQWFGAQYPTYTVRLRDWNDTNQNYDTPIYIQDTGERYASCDGSHYFQLDAGQIPALSGDVDYRIRLTPTTATPFRPAGWSIIAQHFTTAGNQRSWQIQISPAGIIAYTFSPDGAATVNSYSTVAVPSDGTIKAIRLVHVLNNGSGQNTVTFYTSSDGYTYTQLGAVVTNAGTATIYNANFAWQLGYTFQGKIYAFHIWNGGKPVGPLAIDQWQPTTGASFAGSPTLDVLNASKGGANLTYWSDSTRSPKALLDYGQSAVIFGLIHNETTTYGATYLTNIGTYLGTVQSALLNARIVLTTENPRIPGTTYAYHMEERRKEFMVWGPRNNYPVIDTAKAFYDTANWSTPDVVILVDGVHPNVAGTALWLNDFKNAFKASR